MPPDLSYLWKGPFGDLRPFKNRHRTVRPHAYGHTDSNPDCWTPRRLGRNGMGFLVFLCALVQETPPSGISVCGCVSHTEGLFQITVYSPALREIRTETQAGTQRQELKERPFLPACSPWLAQLVFLCNPGPPVHSWYYPT